MYQSVKKRKLGPVPISNKTSYCKSLQSVKSQNREICIYDCPIALKFDRHIGSITADMPVKFQSDAII